LKNVSVDPGPERVDFVLAMRIGPLQPFGDERIDAQEFLAHRHGKSFAGVMDEGVFP
jgi:hypothetical protein